MMVMTRRRRMDMRSHRILGYSAGVDIGASDVEA
jgi:hypothetical protein